MPRTRTKALRAAELLERLKRGPSYHDTGRTGGDPFTPEQAAAQYRQWVESWILDEARDLLPPDKR